MAQHDYIIDNQPGASFRADLNTALAAIVSNNSGATAPTTTYPFQWWADTTAGVLKQRDASNSEWVEVLNLATGTPVGAVTQTGATGAVLLPQGDDSQRPGTIPPAALLVRGSTQDPADYKPEFWNRVSEAWQAIASRPWVTAAITALQNWVSEQIGFTIIYPNGGSAAAPANAAVNSRYVSGNPFGTSYVLCAVELFYNGVWAEPGWDGNTGTSGYSAGARASHITPANEIIVQTGASSLIVASNLTGGGHSAGTVNIVTAPLRVKVWRVKGAF